MIDNSRMGRFIATKRKALGLTQQQLAAKLNVSFQAVSRWENGNYMPPVEMLEELSTLYGLTINELLEGRKLTTEEYKEAAETNIRETLKASTFDLKEKQEFFKKKWRKEHLSTFIACTAAWIILLVALKLQNVDVSLLGTIGGLLAALYYVVLNNRMMTYVEDHLYPKN